MFFFLRHVYLVTVFNSNFCWTVAAHLNNLEQEHRLINQVARRISSHETEKQHIAQCHDSQSCMDSGESWDIDNLIDFISKANHGHSKRLPNGDIDYTKYHTYEEITDWIKEKAANNSRIAHSFKVASTWEGRPILAMKITGESRKKKPGIWLDAGIHSDEWIAPATLVFIIGQLLNGYGKLDSFTQMVDDYVWYILPLVNADGYIYTWTKDRFWRKTRSHHDTNINCFGVDANRNWNFKWRGTSDDLDKCGGNYPGPYPASEPEVQGIADFLLRHNDTIKVYVTYHSFGQQLLLPYAYTDDKDPENLDELEKIAKKVVEGLKVVHGTKFQYGKISKLIGIAQGSSLDWAYNVAGIKYAFGVELQDKGRHGLLLHPQLIVSNGVENFEALRQITNSLPKFL